MQEKQIVAILPVHEAEWLQSKLAREGIDVASTSNNASCRSGCSPTKEVWARTEDVHAIEKIIVNERMQMLADMGANIGLMNQIFDPTAPLATCPACGSTFEPTHYNCSDCGLNFA